MDKNLEIRELFEKNEIDDLKRFINQRQCLNTSNSALIYLFHIVQSAGILTTSIGAGYGIEELVWAGTSLNVVATLISVFEKTNETISKKLMKNIKAIRDGVYVDEDTIAEDDDKSKPLLDSKV